VSDAAAVALAVAVWVGAAVAWPVPRWVGLVVAVVALLLRRPWLLVVGGFALAASLGAASAAGLVPSPSAVAVRGDVVVVGDPVTVLHAVRVDVRLPDGRRAEAWARGAPASALGAVEAGDVVGIEGRLRAPPADAARRLAVRHVVARLDVEAVGELRAGAPLWRFANGVRHTLSSGAASLPAERQALLRGLLLGDDRDIPAPVEADFRASGLTHLLAVSGSNVAFVLAVAGPLIRRFELRGRLLASLALLVWFAVLTRAEPSVLRATAMAAVACWSAFVGRPVSRVRLLALAVSACVLVDPVLVRSVGFRLSVAACVGMALLAAPIAARLPGPRWFADALSVTLAAQAGVAPLLTTTFGGLPLASVPANLLAAPVAGPIVSWGMTAGLVAGVVGGEVASVLHLPTRALLAWLTWVARTTGGAPFGFLDGGDVVLVAGVGAVALRLRRRWALVGFALVALVVARPAVAAEAELARGATLWRGGGAAVLVLEGPADAGRVLEGLRRQGIGRLTLVVASAGNRDVAGTILDLRARVVVAAIAAPSGHRIRDASAIEVATELDVGGLRVRLEPVGRALVATIARGPPVGALGGPGYRRHPCRCSSTSAGASST